MGPKPSDRCSYQKRRDPGTGTQRGYGRAKMEAEAEVRRPQAKERQGMPAVARNQERGPEQNHPQRLGRTSSAHTFGPWPPDLCKNQPLVFSHAVVVIRCGSHRTLAQCPPRSRPRALQPPPGAVVPSGHSPTTTPFGFTLLPSSSCRDLFVQGPGHRPPRPVCQDRIGPGWGGPFCQLHRKLVMLWLKPTPPKVTFS